MISKNPALARRTHRWIKSQALHNRVLRYDYGFKVKIANDRELTIERDGKEAGLMSIPAGAGFLGFRAGRIIVDDGLNQENTATEDQRHKLFDWWFNDIVNILEESGSFAGWIGTPRHPSDLLATLEQNPVYFSRTYRAIKDYKTCDVLWPEKWSFAQLIDRKKEIGSRAFELNYQCEPKDESTTHFPRKILERCLDFKAILEPSRNGYQDVMYFMGGDFSVVINKEHAKKFNSDYTVFVTIALINGQRKIVDIFRERGLTPDEVRDKFFERIKRFQPNLVTVENNVFQNVYFYEFLKGYPYIRPHTTGKEKMDLFQGVPSLSAAFENKKFVLPYGDEKSRKMMDTLVDEFNDFQIGSEHDDIVMATWLCELGIRNFELAGVRPTIVSRLDENRMTDFIGVN